MFYSTIGKSLRRISQISLMRYSKTKDAAYDPPRGFLNYTDELKQSDGNFPYFARRRYKKKFVPIENWRWYADSKDPSGGGAVRESGGRVGKLDSANEDGFFYKLNKSRLEKLKQLLKDKDALKAKETPDKKPKE